MITTYKKFIIGEFDRKIQDDIGYDIARYLTKKEMHENENFQISSKVLERLLLRHSILRNMENVESNYSASKIYVPRKKRMSMGQVGNIGIQDRDPSTTSQKDDGPPRETASNSPSGTRPEKSIVTEFEFDDPSERANRIYRLAVTDLFVEKAIAYLEKDSFEYIRNGKALFYAALTSILSGVFVSITIFAMDVFHLAPKKAGQPWYASILPFPSATSTWMDFATSFVKTFTFYGFLVLFAVFCVRLGKALMDQAERLRERRHSLRQGRLYIHLSNGEVTIEELEKAFDWNVSKGNAFGNIPTEASAPWGTVIKEALKAIPEAFKKAKGSVKD